MRVERVVHRTGEETERRREGVQSEHRTILNCDDACANQGRGQMRPDVDRFVVDFDHRLHAFEK